MRRWRTPAGDVLAEGEAEGAVTRADGSSAATHAYHLIESGRLRRRFRRIDSCLDDWLYVQAYRVEGAGLVSLFRGEDSASGRITASERVEIAGLVPLAPGEPPAPAEIAAILAEASAAAAAERAARAAADAARDAGFLAALRDVPGGGPVELVFAYDAAEAVVVGPPGGPVWWRDTSWPWRGKDLFARLAPLVHRRYAPRPARLTVDPDTARSLLFDPE